jgi:RNA polymerase sigma-70 factor, ECF subfamily
MISPEARGAWAGLVGTLRPWLVRRTRGIPGVDADDVLQDVLLRLYTDGERLRDGAAFGPFVYAIARNTLVDHLRRRRDLAFESEDAATDEPEPYDASVEALVASYVAPFVALLPSPTREALMMTELEGLSHAKAAELAGVSLSAMKARVRRGRAELRHVFEACCAFEQDARGTVTSCSPRPPQVALRRLEKLDVFRNEPCACSDKAPEFTASNVRPTPS